MNVVLDTDGPEEDWEGRDLSPGDDVVLHVGAGMPRSRMVHLPRGGLELDGRISKAPTDGHDLTFGVQA